MKMSDISGAKIDYLLGRPTEEGAKRPGARERGGLKMRIIAAIILIWSAGAMGCYVMKKIQPTNRLYSIYVITVCVIFTILAAWK